MDDEGRALRTFVAVDFDAALRGWFQELLAELSMRYPKIRWVKPQQLHLTLKFLGDVAPSRLPGILEVMADVLVGSSRLSLPLGGPGCFGRRGKPKTLWIGLEPGGDLDRLKGLQAQLEQRLVACGFAAEEWDWTPHLTVGRNPRSVAAGEWESVVSSRQSDCPALQVGEWTLYSSVLTPRGPIYEVVGKHRLG